MTIWNPLAGRAKPAPPTPWAAKAPSKAALASTRVTAGGLSILGAGGFRMRPLSGAASDNQRNELLSEVIGDQTAHP